MGNEEFNPLDILGQDFFDLPDAFCVKKPMGRRGSLFAKATRIS
jgi:hypothetical protein